MPLRIENYGEWRGDRRGGHHPPACTCYRCNEERRRVEASKQEERRVAEYDRRVAENQRITKAGQNMRRNTKPTSPGGGQLSPRTTSQRRAAEAVNQSVASTRSAAKSRPTSRRRSLRSSKVSCLGCPGTSRPRRCVTHWPCTQQRLLA